MNLFSTRSVRLPFFLWWAYETSHSNDPSCLPFSCSSNGFAYPHNERQNELEEVLDVNDIAVLNLESVDVFEVDLKNVLRKEIDQKLNASAGVHSFELLPDISGRKHIRVEHLRKHVKVKGLGLQKTQILVYVASDIDAGQKIFEELHQLLDFWVGLVNIKRHLHSELARFVIEGSAKIKASL